jgi:hypothetical protein
MKVPNQINWLCGYSGGKCGNYSRSSVEKIPRLWQKINLNSPNWEIYVRFER